MFILAGFYWMPKYKMKNAIYDWRNINESNILYAVSTCSCNYCDTITSHCTAQCIHRKCSYISDIQAFKILKFCFGFTRFLENLRRFQMIYGILGKRQRKTSVLFTNTTLENVMQSIFVHESANEIWILNKFVCTAQRYFLTLHDSSFL